MADHDTFHSKDQLRLRAGWPKRGTPVRVAHEQVDAIGPMGRCIQRGVSQLLSQLIALTDSTKGQGP